MTIGVSYWVAFGAVLFLSLLLTTLRRCFIDTPAGLYHPVYAQENNGDDFEEANKLHRIEVFLSLIVQFFRICAAVMWVPINARWFGTEDVQSVLITLAVSALQMWLFTIIFLELVPQVVSTWKGRVLAIRALLPLSRLETLFSPLSRSFRWLRAALLRFLGGESERSEAERAEESIRAAVEIGEREGLLQAGEKSMIESVLEFHEAEIFEVMTPRTDMVCFDASIEIGEAIIKAIECGHSRIPVYRDDVDHIIGVLYVKDLLRYVEEQDRTTPIEKIVRKINFVPETKKVQALLSEFRANRFHIAVVLDEYGGTSGLVTIEDILEEIVGDIEDEYDPAATQLIRKIDSETFDLDGRAPIDELNEFLGIKLPESDDYETVAGFLMSSMGRVPREGDDFEFDQYNFKVTSADERKVKRVMLKQLHSSSSGHASS